MNNTETQLLRWSAQLKVMPAASAPKLQGDKITLPQSALEQLLSAATVTVATDLPSDAYTSTFDPFNPYSFAAERSARPQIYERQQQLPHPLTFRIVNPVNGNIVFAGIREFSAEEDQVGLSIFLRQALGLKEQDPTEDPSPDILDTEARVTVHAHQLPKGTFVRFRPLEAGYDVEDWKALLERYMRDTFTTLTTGEVLSIPSGSEEYRFLVDKVEPEGDGICIIDTDLEVDIEALNEEQARETLKRKLEKSQRAPGSKDGSSTGGDVVDGGEILGKVLPGEYVDYNLKSWNRSAGIEVELHSDDSEGMVDLLISPFAAKHRERPREDTYVFGDLSERPAKRVRIQASNAELEGAEAIWVSVHGYSAPDDGTETHYAKSSAPLQYSLRLSPIDSSEPGSSKDKSVEDHDHVSADEVQCKNCHQWVPKRTLFLHENFCYRNNIPCPKCKEVFKKSSPEWQNHWHCEHDDAHGNNPQSQAKHNDIFHTKRICPSCTFEAPNLPTLAHHRTTLCPGKLILCQFCHLLVPQQGPDDPSPSDPEVIFSGLSPHELADGARTTECHMCGKIIRLRDMSTHLKHHNLERLSRITPRICRNVNCGRTLDGVGPRGEIKRPRALGNDIGLCEVCYGPLYNSAFDPEGKALRRRVERKYLTQLLTGCGKEWCRNEYCKTGRKNAGLGGLEAVITSKEAMSMIKPILEQVIKGDGPLHFCTDEASQKRRVLAKMLAAERLGPDGGSGYDLPWCIAALEAESGDLSKAKSWLGNWAPTRAETST
ncbi:hypothetical protein MMC30_008177 [Trapelia coarctata]|nr:hypothetical protein [Trapelia coarctata]